MPDGNFLNDLDRFFSPYNPRRVTYKQLKFYKRSYIAGWEFLTEHVYKGQALTLRVLFKSDNRYVLPDVAIFPDVLDVLEFPHVENESRLCVWDSVACCDYDEFLYLIALLNEANSLVGKILAGECVEDFRNGFLSYWAYKVDSSLHGISLCDPNNLGTRNVYLYKSKQFGLIFGETEEQVSAWLINNYNIPEDTSKQNKVQKRTLSRIAPTALFCFDRAWLAEEYPDSIGSLRRLVVPNLVPDDHFASLIGEALNNRIHSQLAILVAFPTDNGLCYAGLSFSKGLYSQKSKFCGSTVLDGFRTTIPAHHLLHRVSEIKTLGVSISRADAEWIHGRGKNAYFGEIQKAKVLIIGCGSVGSSVAKMLVKSGVTNLVLIDGESLEIANLSRHELGASYVGRNKAKSLQEELQRNYPHAEITSYEENWQSVSNNSSDEIFRNQIKEADLILSATADWGSDLGLIAMQEQLDLGPIIFAFTEAHAVASHIIVHPDGSNAYQCTHVMKGDNVGAMNIPCSKWSFETRVQLPICGGSFQPYGAAALSYLHAMIAETMLGLITGAEEVRALRKVWMGETTQLLAMGGEWNPEWINQYGDPKSGKLVINLHLNNDEWEFVSV